MIKEEQARNVKILGPRNEIKKLAEEIIKYKSLRV
jgi:hypothetical protein